MDKILVPPSSLCEKEEHNLKVSMQPDIVKAKHITRMFCSGFIIYSSIPTSDNKFVRNHQALRYQKRLC